MNLTSTLHPSTAGATGNPWRSTFERLWTLFKRRWWVMVLCGLLGAGLGVLARWYMPTKYSATAQLLFDPHGIKVFQNDLKITQYDANAGINFVESQMGVLQSERVYSRVITSLCGDGKPQADGKPAPRPASYASFRNICPWSNQPDAWAKALSDLRRLMTIRRTERSFVVDVTAIGRSPELAAQLAGEVVAAYTAEEAETRAEATSRLTGELSASLATLRGALGSAEARADVYRRNKNLIRVADRLLVEQRLAAATAAMNDSQTRLDRSSARMKQIESASNAPSALGALGADADTRTLLAMIERRNAVLVELAPLAARAGARHPALVEVRSRLSEIDRSIAAEMTVIRTAARADLARSRSEQVNLAATVADLSDKLTAARQAEIELRALDQEVAASRKLVESFETRVREATEFGRIETANLRLVSKARAPQTEYLRPKLISWSIVGFVIGLILALVGMMASVLMTPGGDNRRGGDSNRGDGGAAMSPAYAMQLRARAFAQYRYG